MTKKSAVIFIITPVLCALFFGCTSLSEKWQEHRTRQNNKRMIYALTRATERYYKKTFEIPDVPLEQIYEAWQNGSAVIVDARDHMSFLSGRIPGAINLPAASLIDDYFSFAAQVPMTQKIIVYCSSIECKASEIVATILIENGYRAVSHYAKGIEEWNEMSFPLEVSSQE